MSDAFEPAPPSGADGTGGSLPTVPLVSLLLIFGLALIIFVIPPRIRAARTRQRRLATGETPSWFGRSFHGQCLITARLVHPDASPPPGLPPLAAHQAAVLLRLDNTRGRRTVELRCDSACLYTFDGLAIPSLPVADNASPAVLRLPPGHKKENVVLLFPRDPVLVHLEHVYALQLQLDGTLHNVPGLYYATTADALYHQRAYESRVHLLPPLGSPARRPGEPAGPQPPDPGHAPPSSRAAPDSGPAHKP